MERDESLQSPQPGNLGQAGALASHPSRGRPLRVCHLAKFYPPATGGIESHLQTIARAQALLGAAVRVICVNHLDARGADVTWKAFASTPTVEERDGEVELLRVGKRASFARFELCPALSRLARLVNGWDADVVHLHVPNPTMLLALLPCRRVPLVVTYHSDVVKQRKLMLALRPFENVVFGRAARLVATSPPYAESSPTLRRYADKVRVVPFGIDLSPFTSPTEAARGEAVRWRERLGGPLWLTVGRLVYYKGLSTALEALRDAPGHLLAIGEGPLAEELQVRARELGVSERVTLYGRATEDEVIGAYHAAAALWFPSNARSEAFGFAQVEAMASGCPVLNTDIPGSGVPWVSRHEESGLTVPVGDAKALAAAARRLVEDGGCRQRLAAGGVARATREFDARTMASRTFQLYQDVLLGAKGA